MDVGCGAGALGAALKLERPSLQVRGVEIVPEAAERARAVLDDVATMSADDPLPDHWPRPDCVLFADVLEHLLDPWSTLRSWRERVLEGGWIVVSLPNVGHHSVVRDLIRGDWRYASEGLLDRTHVRFFTRATAVELVEQANFQIERVRRMTLAGNWIVRRWIGRACKKEARGQKITATSLRLLDLCTYQIHIVGRVRSSAKAASA